MILSADVLPWYTVFAAVLYGSIVRKGLLASITKTASFLKHIFDVLTHETAQKQNSHLFEFSRILQKRNKITIAFHQ